MKPNVVHVIKSARIAKSRMITSILSANPKQRNSDLRFQIPLNSSFPKNNDTENSKKELSQSTKCSQSPRAHSTQKSPRRQIKSPKTDSENASQVPTQAKSIQTKSNKPANKNMCKKIKPSLTSNLPEDTLPWTEEEMEQFETIFGEVVFDNTIDIHTTRQADLQLLTQRPFRSYRKTQLAGSGDWACREISGSINLGRQLIEQSGKVTVSDSQLKALMLLCQSEKAFFEVLKGCRDVLVNYLEKTKLNPRRKLLK